MYSGDVGQKMEDVGTGQGRNEGRLQSLIGQGQRYQTKGPLSEFYSITKWTEKEMRKEKGYCV